MTEEHIRSVLARAGHLDHAGAVESLMQTAVRAIAKPLGDDAMAGLPLGGSRLGGVPDLPSGGAWPSRDGAPLQHIAQVRLDDVAGIDPDGRLPTHGTLIFFGDPETGAAAVIHSELPGGQLVRAEPPSGVRVHRLSALTFEHTMSIPGAVSPWIAPPLASFWHDFTSRYARDLRDDDDPRQSHHLLGYIDGRGDLAAHANGTADQLLLQVDDDDGRRLCFLLRKDELAARDFSKVRLAPVPA